MPKEGEHTPDTALSTLSLSRSEDGKIKLHFESESVADSDTPLAGIVFSDCESFPGMSGSQVFRTDAVDGYKIVGVTTGTFNPIGKTPLKYFIYSKVLTPFIRGVLDGENKPRASNAGNISVFNHLYDGQTAFSG